MKGSCQPPSRSRGAAMPAWNPRANELFTAALELGADERRAFLDRECPDAEQRRQVEALLAAHAAAGDFLNQPPADATGVFIETDAVVGSIIGGKYKLLEVVGEGGMGTVFMAQQTEPVKRAVAVKVIKTGMDSRQVLARFEAERQALALMDHPNIAKVLDAGTTEHGRPYFVMELVKGTPITRFCDERRLSPRERLDLFVPVCQAI